jgi:hypothetical protein
MSGRWRWDKRADELHRVEHRAPNQSPRTLASAETRTLAAIDARTWCDRLSREGAVGTVAVVNERTGETVAEYPLEPV